MVTCPPGHYCESGINTQVIEQGLNYYDLRSKKLYTNSDHWIERGQGLDTDNSTHYKQSFIPQCIKQYLSQDLGDSPPKPCPNGYFCTLAAKSILPLVRNYQYPIPCFSGYLCDPTDGESFNNTKACAAGMFCPSEYSGDFCKSLNGSCVICECPQGYHCPFQNMNSPTKCEAGTYQDKCGQTTCIPCAAGFYCDEIGTENITVFMKLCPPGYSCPKGLKDKSLCVPGTYNPYFGQAKCLPCPRGYYCFTEGLEKTTICDPGYMCHMEGMDIAQSCQTGYYCIEGVSYFDKINNTCPDGETCPIICPPGHKCVSGSSVPTECSEGTYQPNSGQSQCLECEPGYFCPNTSLSSMVPCTAGYFCNISGLAAPFGQCPSGFYCLEGTISSTSTATRKLELFECDTEELYGDVLPKEPIPCPISTYCSVGTASGLLDSADGPKKCSSGYFNDRCAQGTCQKCPDGFYCPDTGMQAPLLCPLGTYRSGLSINCEPCPVGTWANDKQGLQSKSECTPCPAGYYCDKTGTDTMDSMKVCTSGFYCEAGTSKPVEGCPQGYFCPAGTKSKDEVKLYKCPPGYYCPEQTVITPENFSKCKSNLLLCEAGKKCPINKFCPLGTNSSVPDCPEGTVSAVQTQDISECEKDLNAIEKIYKSINILDIQTNQGFDYLKAEPLQFLYFEWNTSNYPKGNIPNDYVPFIYISETDNKIPFVQQESYKPTFRIPLALKSSTFISTSKKNFKFIIHCHKVSTISFSVDVLNGLYSASKYIDMIKNSIKLISVNTTARNVDSSFVIALARVSSNYFDEPSNLAFHGVLTDVAEDFSSIKMGFVQEVSVSFLSSLEEDDEADYFPQNSKKLWEELDYTQNLYPLEYLPYISDCDGFGAYVPIYELYNHENCSFVSKDKTVTVQILNPGQVPNGDHCDIKFTCRIHEKLDSSGKPWFSAYELSKANIFYITRPQLIGVEYDKAVPGTSEKENKFSLDYYGSGNLIEVKAYRGTATYTSGMIPRKVKLLLEYYQKTILDKEILRAGIYFSEFDSSTENRDYEFSFELQILGWRDCLDLFAFEEYLYYTFVILICLLIFLTVVSFWLINYIKSTILPRPSLKVGLYIKYSFRAFTGVIQAAVPVFGVLLSFYYGLINTNILKQITGDYDDLYPISLSNVNDSTRITKYMNGRLGTCILILGWYMVWKTTTLLFPPILKSPNPKDLPSLNSKNQKMSSLYIFSTLQVLIFCCCSFQFAKSAVFLEYQTLFLIVFKIINSRIVGNLRATLKDNLYILPFFGALSLNTTLITVKVGAFTAFLTGYLTNVAIKIFKRTFVEPYRIQIMNQVLRIKKRFKLTGNDVVQSLPFKDRVYIEQINDLGANSMELVASVLFPAMIIFNFIFYNELKLTISKSFLKYFVVFSSIQAFAEVGYDVFLNNAIECKTGRLLSEKIVELKEIFDSRETDWALSSALPHSGRSLTPELDNLLRFGFSSQYFLTMTVGILAIILQVYGIDFWMISSYNPFKDSVTLVLVFLIPLIILISEKLLILTLNLVFKRKQKSESETGREFYEEIRYFVLQELEENGASSKYEMVVKAFARAVYDKYHTFVQEKQRKAAVARFLKNIEELGTVGKIALEEVKNLYELPLPKVRMRIEHLKLPKRESVLNKLKKKNGYWSPFLVYPWKAD